MKLNINRPDFLKSWQIAEHFSNDNILISASDENTKLKATNLKTSVSCNVDGVHVEEGGEALIPVAIFGGMIRKSASDDLFLNVNSERGFLQCGASKMKFVIIPTEQFPKILDKSDAEEICEIDAELFISLIIEATLAASKPTDFPKYHGVCLLKTADGKIKAASTDGKRLALATRSCEEISKETELLLPAYELKNLARTITGDKKIKIFANDSIAWFDLGDIVYSVRLVEAAFPQYERILNDNVETSITVKNDDLMKVLERIDVIAKTTITHSMKINLNTNGEIKISTCAAKIGTVSEVIIAEVSGRDMQIGFNVGYFIDCLKVIGSEDIRIEFSGEESQARITRGNDFLYMIMPVRLSLEEE